MERMKIITTLNDLRQIISDQTSSMDLSCYDMDEDDLIDFATSNMLDFLEEKGFTMGNDLNEFDITDNDFWNFFETNEDE